MLKVLTSIKTGREPSIDIPTAKLSCVCYMLSYKLTPLSLLFSVSLTSTVNGLMTGSQVCHTETLEVTLYSRMGDFGLSLQGGIFQTDVLGSPAIIGYIEPGGKADK